VNATEDSAAVAPLSAAASHTRDRILDAASGLLARGGIDALSNRAIATAAGVQAPTIYRIFGDKQGLLDALAVKQFADHLTDKAALELTADPVEDLRTGWNHHIQFGLDNPALYLLVYGDPRPSPLVPAAAAAARLLAGYVHRVAESGLLAVDEPHAAQLIHATGRGVTLTLLGTPRSDKDMRLSTLAREAVINAITVTGPNHQKSSVTAHAIGMRAVLNNTPQLSAHERDLMEEWLDRIIAGQAGSHSA
jgi:AcrR family transcriptional regulator